MLKKALFLVAVVAMLGGVANAADTHFKTHGFSWTKVYTPIETGCVIKVKMDIGYYVKIPGCPGLEIKMDQIDYKTYEGKVAMTVICNFALTIVTEIENLNVVPGNYSSWANPANLPAGNNSTDIYARLENANLAGTTVGNNVHVANVKILVKPQ